MKHKGFVYLKQLVSTLDVSGSVLDLGRREKTSVFGDPKGRDCALDLIEK